MMMKEARDADASQASGMFLFYLFFNTNKLNTSDNLPPCQLPHQEKAFQTIDPRLGT